MSVFASGFDGPVSIFHTGRSFLLWKLLREPCPASGVHSSSAGASGWDTAQTCAAWPLIWRSMMAGSLDQCAPGRWKSGTHRRKKLVPKAPLKVSCPQEAGAGACWRSEYNPGVRRGGYMPYSAGAQARRVYKRVGRKTAKFRAAAAAQKFRARSNFARAGFDCQARFRGPP